MYSTRTKKITSYGRRAQRFVAVRDDRPRSSLASKPASKPDRPVDTWQLSDASEAKEDSVCVFPTVTAMHKPTAASHGKLQLSNASPASRKRAGKKYAAKGTPIRPPLGAYQINVPNSPAVPPKGMKARLGVGKGTPSTLRQVSAISPYVDVDIIVVDDTGRRLSQERRVTKTNVQVNVVGVNTRKARATVRRTSKRAVRPTPVKKYMSSSSEEENDDDDDDEYVPVAKVVGKQCLKEPSTDSPNAAQPNRTSRASVQMKLSRDSLDSDFQSLRRPQASKRAARTIVTTDSESDHETYSPSDRAWNTKPKEISKARPAPIHVDAFQHTLELSAAAENREPRKSIYVKRQTLPPRDSTGFSIVAHNSITKKTDTIQVKPCTVPTPTIHLTRTPHERTPDVELSFFPRRRQLTPIRPSRSKPAFLQQKSRKSSLSRTFTVSDDDNDSSSIDEELELALKVADLELSESAQSYAKTMTALSYKIDASGSTSQLKEKHSSSLQSNSHRPYVPSYLRPLLSECGQLTPFDFFSFIETFAVDPIINFSDHSGFSADSCSDKSLPSFQKVGEASYSEVFGIGNVVLKVVPLLDEDNDVSVTWTADWDSPPVSEAKDVLKEILVTRAMGEICKGFIKLLKAHVVQGSYPPSLLALWDTYGEKKGSESVRPDCFTEKQAYAIIILPNGGPDLESFSFGSPTLNDGFGWRQACSVFWQVTRSLGRAEELVHFEHRDLHWGQILVRHTSKPSRLHVTSACGTVSMDDPSHGVQSTIIDLGLARIDHGYGNSYWTPFAEEIFEGEGDYQYDVYRMMRKCNTGEWRSFRPLTNVMWLHYLADKLINHKQIRPPTSRAPGRPSRNSSHLDADKRAYDCLVEVETILGFAIASIARSVGAKVKKRLKNTRKLTAVLELKCAADVLRMGKEQGWVL